jgi:hypothetical protein
MLEARIRHAVALTAVAAFEDYAAFVDVVTSHQPTTSDVVCIANQLRACALRGADRRPGAFGAAVFAAGDRGVCARAADAAI